MIDRATGAVAIEYGWRVAARHEGAAVHPHFAMARPIVSYASAISFWNAGPSA